MNVTIIGTGNMARGIGARLLAGGHEVTVLGKQTADAEEVVKDLGANGSAKAGQEVGRQRVPGGGHRTNAGRPQALFRARTAHDGSWVTRVSPDKLGETA